MFHAGAVLPSSVFLLQLLIPPGGDVGTPLEVTDPPVRVGLIVRAVGRARGLKVEEPLGVVVVRPKLGEVGPGVEKPAPPVVEGLMVPAPLRLGPIVHGKCEGLTELATRLNALKHCRTCAGSFDS